MRRNHGPRPAFGGWPVRRFVVVEDSMLPTLRPGDGLLALRGWQGLRAPIAVATRYLVKRVGGVRRSGSGATFEALSDNAGAPGATDSREFGWVQATQSYRVVWTVRAGTAGSGSGDANG